MTDCPKGGTKSENVADSWEEAGDEATAKILDERKKELELKKQKEEEMLKAREAAQQMHNVNTDKPTFQILKRPSGWGGQTSTAQDMAKLEEKTRTMSLQEREAAYKEARERIFKGYRPEDEVNKSIDPNLQMVTGTLGCATGGVPQIHPVYHTPTPRPRLPTIIRTPRPALYQQPPIGVPLFGLPPPPPPGAYTQPLPSTSQQRFPLLAGLQVQQQQFPYFDSRIPPPAAPLPPTFMRQNTGQNPVGINPAYSDPARSNPAPYGRPPAQLMSQNQFTSAFNDQITRFY